jgi:3-oxoadipate enol-lactonase
MQKRMTRYEYFWTLAPWFFGPKTFAKPGFIDNWAKKAASNPHPQPLRVFSQLVEAGSQFDNRAQLKNIRQPTLVMVGECDILIPPYQSRALAKGIPGAEMEMIPGVGHQCVIEDAQGVIDRVTSFLKRVDTR